jgi:hypothetical protein
MFTTSFISGDKKKNKGKKKKKERKILSFFQFDDEKIKKFKRGQRAEKKK